MDQARLAIREKSKEFLERIKADPPYRIPGTGAWCSGA